MWVRLLSDGKADSKNQNCEHCRTAFHQRAPPAGPLRHRAGGCCVYSAGVPACVRVAQCRREAYHSGIRSASRTSFRCCLRALPVGQFTDAFQAPASPATSTGRNPRGALLRPLRADGSCRRAPIPGGRRIQRPTGGRPQAVMGVTGRPIRTLRRCRTSEDRRTGKPSCPDLCLVAWR